MVWFGRRKGTSFDSGPRASPLDFSGSQPLLWVPSRTRPDPGFSSLPCPFARYELIVVASV